MLNSFFNSRLELEAMFKFPKIDHERHKSKRKLFATSLMSESSRKYSFIPVCVSVLLKINFNIESIYLSLMYIGVSNRWALQVNLYSLQSVTESRFESLFVYGKCRSQDNP